MKTPRTGRVAAHVFTYGSTLVFLLPVYILINVAFRPADDLSAGLLPSSEPTLANFSKAWNESELPSAIVTSAIVTTLSCLAIVVLSTMAAYPLARSTARLSNVTFYLFLVGLLLPFQVALLPLYLMMRDMQLLGTVWSLVIFYTGLQMPFSIFLVTTFLRTSVAVEYEEAARIDGCSDLMAFVRVVRLLAVEAVEGDDERQARVLEVVDGGEAVGEPPRVDQNDRADGAAHQVVPHEPEAVLAGRTEEVQDQVLVERDASEVHGDRRGRLVPRVGEVVDARGRGCHHGLGAQRIDLRDSADERGFAHAEAARHHDLRGSGGAGRTAARACEVH